MTKISGEEVNFFTPDLAIYRARLFEWEGDLYRAIRLPHASFYRRLVKDQILEKLINRGFLVETEPTLLSLDGYGEVLKHRRIPFVTYPFEWPGFAFRDAALLLIDLNLELANYGLGTLDAHSWNIVLDGPRPVFVDLDSIISLSKLNASAFIREFYSYFIYPLHLIELGQERIARWLMHDHLHGISESEFLFLSTASPRSIIDKYGKRVFIYLKSCLPQHLRRRLHAFMLSIRGIFQAYNNRHLSSWPHLLEQMRRKVESIHIDIKTSSWLSYYERFPDFDNEDDWTIKHQSIAKALNQLKPTTLLDIASNKGWYSQLAAYRGSKVAAFDVDESCVNHLYIRAKKQHLSLLPLVMDCRSPSPGYGWRHRPASERLKADCVLGLALIHHLVFKQRMDFEQIGRLLQQFTKQYLIVEFIPKEDSYIRKWKVDNLPWYTLENFLHSLSSSFIKIEILPSWPDPRVLIICKRSVA